VTTVADTPATQGPRRKPIGTVALPPGVVAILAIGLAAGCFAKFDSIGRAVVAAGFCVALVVLSSIDLERRIIPNRIVLPAGLLVLLGDIAVRPHRAKEWALAAFVALVVGTLISLATRGGIGMGDAKLGFLMGAGLGWSVFSALVWSSIAMFLAAVVVLMRGGLAARKDRLPFGPFLALGAILALFLS
jgi:leader peptidase (prepilin peptidase) / N-methyltransferase